MAKVKKHMILYTELEQWNLVLSTVVNLLSLRLRTITLACYLTISQAKSELVTSQTQTRKNYQKD